MSGGADAVSESCVRAHDLAPEQSSGVGTAFHSWPRQTRLPLAALPTAPSVARGHVRAVAYEWGLRHLADIAELLASELVTNAVKASDRLKARADVVIVPVVLLGLASDGNSILLRVWDGCQDMPTPQDADVADESGRGLMLVDTLSKDWGCYLLAAGGKVVWCLIG
jgi:anti-sigma regulatory factor (Ser/Thr protein kinase)